MKHESDGAEDMPSYEELFGDPVVLRLTARFDRSAYEVIGDMAQIGRDILALSDDEDAEISLDVRKPVG